MKTSSILVIASLVTCAILGAANTAKAAVVAYDNFDYGYGDLNGKNGGGGSWTSAWTAASSVDTLAGGALELVGNDDNVAFRTFSSFTGSQLFFSANVKFDGVLNGPPGPDFFSIWLDNNPVVPPSPAHLTPNIGVMANTGGVNTPFFDYFLRIDPTFPKFSTTQAVVGDTVQLVGLLEKVAGSYSKLSLWVNTTPGYYNSPTPDVVHTFASGFTSLSRIGFRTANLDVDDKITVDEVWLGTLPSDVNIIPEPATIAIWGSLSLVGLAAGYRRRKLS